MTSVTPTSPNGHGTPPPSGPDNPSPTAELTALAARLCRLADHVDDLDTRGNGLADAIADQVLPRLAEHAAQIRQLLDTGTTIGDGSHDWAAMDADRASVEWDTLARWIEQTLVPWFEITRDQLPDCWALHRPAVIELAWLHRAHQAAHQPGAAPHLPAEWHTRWKPAALRAIRDAVPRRGARVCGPGQHLASEADRVRRHPMGGPPPGASVEPTSVPAEQLAERRHWQPFYDEARVTDLQLRRGIKSI